MLCFQTVTLNLVLIKDTHILYSHVFIYPHFQKYCISSHTPHIHLLTGLSAGLHQCGVAESRWAIEKVEPDARAYGLNATNCTVFTDDCNELLKLVMQV